MSKYSYSINGESFADEEVFDSVEEATEAAYETLSNMDLGAEILNMSNPGDYDYDEDEFSNADIDIIEVD